MTTTDPFLDVDLTADGWTTICPLDRLTPDRGMAALVDGAAVAVFHLSTGDLFAVGNVDPFSGASVFSRGLVGEVAGTPTVASPLYKQRFELPTGRCLDHPDASVPVHPVRVVDGVVQLLRAERS